MKMSKSYDFGKTPDYVRKQRKGGQGVSPDIYIDKRYWSDGEREQKFNEVNNCSRSVKKFKNTKKYGVGLPTVAGLVRICPT
jgi:hypothetical protein